MKFTPLVANATRLGLCLALVAATAVAGVKSERNRAGKLDDKTTGANIRASQLIGMNIQNTKGEGVGEVKDIVLDANTGRVRYAAVTYGGFLGVGNKLFAVPFAAFKIRQDKDDRDEYLLVLDVNKKTLEGAEGFDQEHWPDFADPKLTRELDIRYGVDVKVRVRKGSRNE